MDEAAVMDATVVDVEPVATGVEDGGANEPESGQPEEGIQQETNEQDLGAQDPNKAVERAITPDGRNLTPTAKAALDKLRTENPKLANIFRDALFAESRMKAVFPGGLQEAKTISQAVKDFGGVDGIKGIQGELGGWRDWDAQFTAGDPAAIDFMLKDPEGKASFLKLAPVAFQKFGEANPEGYAAYVSQAIYSDIARNELPTALRMMEFCLARGDAEGLKEPFELLKGWFAAIKDTAQKPVTPKEPEKPQVDPKMQELQQQVESSRRDQWRAETARDQTTLVKSEFDRLAAGRTLGEQQMGGIKNIFESQLRKAITQHQEKLDAYFKSGDREGFMKYADSINKKEIPRAMRMAFDVWVPGKPGPKAGTAKPAATAQPAKAAAGFVMGTRPNNIDWRNPFNSPANIKAGRAVTIDGKKIQWTPGLQPVR